MTRVLGPLLLGFVGCLILTSLGVWQLQRLAWKEGILAEMDDLLSGEVAAAIKDVYLVSKRIMVESCLLRGEPVQGDIEFLMKRQILRGVTGLLF